jgi:hypothetical protein
MTKFVVGAICGFLACVWAIQTTPLIAFTAFVQRLEEVRANSAIASQAYDTTPLRPYQHDDGRVERTNYP